MRLLVAEDDPRLLKTLLHIFQSNNFSADGVSNGRDALLYARSTSTTGLVLDIMMPEMDGIQVLRELRRLGINTPALFLTARTEVAPAGGRAGRRGGRLSAQTLCHRGTAGPGAGDAAPQGDLPARPAGLRSGGAEPVFLSAGAPGLHPAAERAGEFQILEMLMQAPGLHRAHRTADHPSLGLGTPRWIPAWCGYISPTCAKRSAR